MEKNPKTEEQLSEELLDSIMGSTGSSKGPRLVWRAKLMAHCDECQSHAASFRVNMSNHNNYERQIDTAVRNNQMSWAGALKTNADVAHWRAEEAYNAIKAHRHPDFPDALGPLV